MKNKTIQSYSDESYPPFPTKGTLFWRCFMPWQAFRFVVLNFRIIKIVVGGHS
jgi:hypothetical protein